MNKTIDNPTDREISRWLTYALLDTFTDYSLTHDKTDPNVILFNELEHTDEKITMVHFPIRNDEHNVEDLENLKVEYLGKNGKITQINSLIKEVPNDEKREFGMKVNEIRNYFNDEFSKRMDEFLTEEDFKEQITFFSSVVYDFALGKQILPPPPLETENKTTEAVSEE